MNGKIYEDIFDCDGDCGAKVELTSHDSTRRINRGTLESLGWLVISGAEAYCPECQKTASKIASVLPTARGLSSRIHEPRGKDKRARKA